MGEVVVSYTYKVVPFMGRSQGTVSPSDVARQLESSINQHAAAGWEFVQLTDVKIEVQPGCLAGLFGSAVEYVHIDQLIFRSAQEIESRHVSGAIPPVIKPPLGVPAARQEQTSAEVKPYQPERIYGGKIACWKCAAANDPRLIHCSQCDIALYERA
jgi:hypothetical protein